MGSEWLEWLKVIAPIVMLMVSALFAVAGYFAKKTFDGFTEEMKLMRANHENLEKDFLRFQAHLPRLYVLKDDHIRHVTLLEKKIDDLDANMRDVLASIVSDIKVLLRETPKRKADG